MKYLGIRLPLSTVKMAIHKQDAEYFREALLSRLAEGAFREGHLNWRCVAERQDASDNSVILLFEEAPDSHPETILTHSINRLLEVKNEGKE
jgi:hypothetical protein